MVLQQPRHFGEDNTSNNNGNREDRGRLRDILNPSSSDNPAPPTAPPQPALSIMSAPLASGMGAGGSQGGLQGPPPAPTPPGRPHHHGASFSLRSPTQASSSSLDFHNQRAPLPSLSYSTSPTNNRSILNNTNNHHYMTSPVGGTSLPPPLQPPAGLVTSSSVVSVGPPPSGTSNLHHPDRSPLHPPPVYYPQDTRDRERDRDRDRDRDLREPVRERPSTGSFYDPTTDSVTTSNGTIAKERRISDAAGSWHNSGAAKVSTPKVSLAVLSTFTSIKHAATPSSLCRNCRPFNSIQLSAHLHFLSLVIKPGVAVSNAQTFSSPTGIASFTNYYYSPDT
ncbi:hypothetical protein GE09DRAFT_614871 [Coniochaeta sp. 2T2.1]|nr:hypothetical protein GE09DRAFT_614871 [Coniochaeta sp. 2T2.1]